MDFSLSEEQSMIQETTRRMVERDINPILAAHPSDRSLPREPLGEIYRLLAAR